MDIFVRKGRKIIDSMRSMESVDQSDQEFWGRSKVEYLGHQVSLAGLEANPKDLGSLVNIPFPTTFRSVQSFLGSLNYNSCFIEDFAVYASVLYELREADFFRDEQYGRS